MSTANLPAYVNPSLHRTPSYAEEPREYEQRIALADRLRPRPSGNFVKQSKGGGASLRLSAQEDDVALPVYGSGGLVEGTVDLSKTESVTSVEVKIEGRLLIKEIAEGGSTSAKLCLNTALLWIKDANNPVCPSSLRFSIPLPHTFTYEDKTFPLPPSFDVKLSGLPGFIATIDYSVSATIAKPHLVPQIRSKKFGIHIGSSIVSTPFIYYPRSRPASAIPAPLVANATGFQPTPSWRVFESSMRSKSTTRDDITTKFYIPTSRMFYMSEPIPFHMTLEASAVSLAAFLPFMPTAHTSGPVKVTRVQLMRQTTVDVRDTVVSGVKTDIWRTDCIGEGTFNLARDGPTSISFSGEIKIADNVKIPGFKAAGLSVKDCILLTVNPIDPGNAPFFDMRQVIPVRLSTDPWTPNGAGIGAHQADAWNRTPSPEDSEPLKRAPST
ncbi:hypothetical protein B0H34DRAFT_707732 [Crassisporium funariophilum]|nr:hypothetical protein B0H34DRAFT_707732 [Crassisporium funariophilum]